MAYELHATGTGTHRVARLVRKQVEDTLELLRPEAVSDAAIHAARKHLKKARAALRLLRDALGPTMYARENAALRDAARPLRTVRDGTALLDQLDSLIKRYGAPARAVDLVGLRRLLERERTAARAQLRRSRLRHETTLLRGVVARSARWPVGRRGWSVLGPGLKRVYKRGRNALAVARGERTPEALHEWRKQVKYFWHQLQLLQPLWPGHIGELAEEAHSLGDHLGNDHDLAVLRSKVLEHPQALAGPARSALVALIDRARTELQEKALALGERIYEEKPREFAARFERYWRTWRKRAA